MKYCQVYTSFPFILKENHYFYFPIDTNMLIAVLIDNSQIQKKTKHSAQGLMSKILYYKPNNHKYKVRFYTIFNIKFSLGAKPLRNKKNCSVYNLF